MKDIFPKIPLIFSIILFLVCASGFYFLHTRINKNNALAEDSNLKWQEEVAKIEEAQMLNRGIKAVELEAALVDTHFGKNSDLVPFLDTVEGLAVAVGAKAETTSVVVSPDSQSLMVGVNADGNFQSLYKYLTLLENSPYSLQFVYVKFVRTSADGAAPTWRAEFMIKLVSFIN